MILEVPFNCLWDSLAHPGSQLVSKWRPALQARWDGSPPRGPHFSHTEVGTPQGWQAHISVTPGLLTQCYNTPLMPTEVRHLCLIRPFQQRLSFFSNGARAAPIETGGLKDEEDPPIQSWGLEQTPWLCRLLLEPGCTWIQPWSQAGLLLCVWELAHVHTHRWPDGHQQLQRKQNKLPKQIKTLHLPKQMRFFQLNLSITIKFTLAKFKVLGWPVFQVQIVAFKHSEELTDNPHWSPSGKCFNLFLKKVPYLFSLAPGVQRR